MEQSVCKVQPVDCYSITDEKVVFSEDSKFVCLSCGESIRVYSVKTGQLVHTLAKHKSCVSGLALNPKNPYQLVSVCTDGELIIWDYEDGIALRVIELEQSVAGLQFAPRGLVGSPSKGFLACFVIARKVDSMTSEKEGKVAHAAVCVDWELLAGKGEDGGRGAGGDLLQRTKPVLHSLAKKCRVVFTHKGDCLVGFHRKDLLVYNFEQEHVVKHVSTYLVTCVAAHPSRDCVATGNKHGEVLLWYDFMDSKSPPVCSVLHWHAHQVHDVHFTPEGTNLLSVGMEGVMVIWKVESKKSTFRPHLGGPINTICSSPRGEYFALGMGDNTVNILSSYTNEVESTVGSLIRAHVNPGSTAGVLTGLVREPGRERVVLNASLGHLQFYDPVQGQLASELNVTGLNYVTQADKVPLVPTLVSFVQFSPSGDWMVTVESREDRMTTPELRMKFWKYSRENQRFELNTLVDPPHYSSLTGVAFSPGSEQMCATASHDGCFKTWLFHSNDQQDESSWFCSSESHYIREPAISCVFSRDGSILAVLYEKYITLWKPDACAAVKKVFAVPSVDEVFRFVCFQTEASTHYLVASTFHSLYVWNLTSCAVCWSVKAKVEQLVACPFLPCVAAFVRRNGTTNMSLFSPSDPTPLALFEDVCSTSVLGAVFLKSQSSSKPSSSELLSKTSDSSSDCNSFDGRSWYKTCTLYFMTQDQELYRIGLQTDDDEEKSLQLKYHRDSEGQNVYEQIFGLHSGPSPAASSSPQRAPAGLPDSKLSKIFSGPPHTLPPMSMLCSVFLRALHGQDLQGDGPQVGGEDEESVEVDSEELSSSEEEGEVLHTKDETQGLGEAQERMEDSEFTSKVSFDKSTTLTKENIGDFMWLTDVFKQMK
uniref:WD repeat-containing protein 75-like protein n=1 Tax=Halisarca dujardinii TaxID=2583056 RepID=A0AA96S2F9_HALDU|nr:WD repeat-containing protein 75-like protein [Halisarca dujardinii]